MSDLSSFLPKALSDRFEIVEELQRRESSAVFLVRELGGAGALRVLKLVSPDRDEQIEELAAEFRLLQGVRHPHLTSILEFGHHDDRFWLVREYVPGVALAALGPTLTDRQRVAVFRDLLRALGHLHARGLLHLDLKPENVLLKEDGEHQVGVLTDFGLSVQTEEQRSSGPSSIRGTPPFVAPEILLGLEPDVRSDLFSLGVTLLASLPGAPDLDPGLLYRSFPGKPFAESLNLDLGRLGGELAPLLSRLLATDPASRPASAADALALLPGAGSSEEDPLAFAPMLRPLPAFQGDPAADRLESFVSAGSEREILWLEAPNTAEADEVASRARFSAALHQVPLHQLSAAAIQPEAGIGPLSAEHRAAGSAVKWARELLGGPEKALLLVRLDGEQPGLGQAALTIARLASHPIETGSQHGRLLIVSTTRLPDTLRSDLAAEIGAPTRTGELTQDQIVLHLQQLEGRGDAEGAAARQRLERLARALIDASAAEPARIEALLRSQLEQGRITVRSGRFDFSAVDPAKMERLPQLGARLDGRSAAEQGVLLLLDLLGENPTLKELLPLLESEEEVAVRSLLEDRWIVVRIDGTVRLEHAATGALARERLADADQAKLAERILSHGDRGSWKRPLTLALAGRAAEAADDLRQKRDLMREQESGAVTRMIEEVAAKCGQSREARRQVQEFLAEHLVHAGNLAGAATLLQDLLSQPLDVCEDEVRLLSRAATIDLMRSRFDHAEELFLRARRRLSRPGVKEMPDTRLEIERGLGFARFLRGDAAGAMRTLDGIRRTYLGQGLEIPYWIQILLGTFAFRAGNTARAREELEIGLAAAREKSDPEAVATALTNLATLFMGEGNLGDARAALEQAREIRARLAHPFEEAVVLGNLGILLRDEGRLQEAARHLREALRLHAALSDPKGKAIALSNLAMLKSLGGDLEGARCLLEQAITHLAELGASVEAALSRCRLCGLFVDAGMEAEARAALAAVPALESAPRVDAYRQLTAARLALRFEDPAEGLKPAGLAAERFAAAGDKQGATRALLCLARILIRCGSFAPARRHLSEAGRLRSCWSRASSPPASAPPRKHWRCWPAPGTRPGGTDRCCSGCWRVRPGGRLRGKLRRISYRRESASSPWRWPP